MNKIALLEKIEELRQLMHYLITKEKDLLNTEVIKVSQQLSK
ncbi:aspartyl-phosphate phosphatase Spo0E family protein [uncultured Clostridium sp.]|nr:aspartyl-phosphate phosphatase Spo0E family protein [uncultured Clostridium sp.]